MFCVSFRLRLDGQPQTEKHELRTAACLKTRPDSHSQIWSRAAIFEANGGNRPVAVLRSSVRKDFYTA